MFSKLSFKIDINKAHTNTILVLSVSLTHFIQVNDPSHKT